VSARGASVPARRDEASAAWFDALREGRLLMRRCHGGHLSHPDVLACDDCGDRDLRWQAVHGHGMVVSLAVDHSGDDVTRLAIIELSEGPWLLTRVEGVPPERGDEVTIRVVEPADGEPYPVVTTDASAAPPAGPSA
jgi:uncharacterized OB-fold protein